MKKIRKKMNKIYTSKANRGNELKINSGINVLRADWCENYYTDQKF